jgi:hypothetical protein
MLALSDEAIETLLAEIPQEKRMLSWWLVLPDGNALPGDGGGGVVLLSEISSTHWLGGLLARLRLSPMVDRLDLFVARRRGRLSRYVPDVPAPHRYP